MKTMKSIVAFGLALAMCFFVSTTVMAAMATRQTVTLTYPDTDKETSQYSGTSGQGKGANSSDSTVPMNYYLKSSTGGGWSTKAYKIVAIGGSWNSNIYAASGDALYKVTMMRQPAAFPGYTYWKATGTIRTDK